MKLQVGSMVALETEFGELGWIKAIFENGMATVILQKVQGAETEVEVALDSLTRASSIEVSGKLSDYIEENILAIRKGNYSNLALMVEALDPDSDISFDSFTDEIRESLDKATCQEIGAIVCKIMNFSFEEAHETYNNVYKTKELPTPAELFEYTDPFEEANEE